MTALILAAGRGERMQDLTKDRPKPLLPLTDKTLIEHRIEALKQAGIEHIIINLFYLGHQIEAHLQDGEHLGVTITYSYEQERLDVGGGIIQASKLTTKPSLIITNADIDTDFDYSQLVLPKDHRAHLVLTDNPHHNPDGDFHLQQGQVFNNGDPKLTFTGISVMDAQYFATLKTQPLSFGELIKPLIEQGQVSGEYYSGYWLNVDTPQRLDQAHNNHDHF